MSSRIRTTFALIASILSAMPVFAHPGHGTTDPQTVSHYAVEPLHLLPTGMLAIAGVVFCAVIMSRRHRSNLQRTRNVSSRSGD